jgi:RimJ/RimL family protein N-acetyltransferase
MIRTQLETERLRLRLFTLDDLSVMFKLNTDPEVGYRYFKEFWGKGIGTEAARVCVEFARTDLNIKKLIALIMPENIGSIKLAEKLGMTRGPLIHIYDVDAWQYEMML